MADIHIDDFYHDCTRILVRLHEVFPRLTSVYIDDIIGRFETDEYGIASHRHQACFDTLLWLAAEGYIRYQDRVRTEGLDQVVLTEKAFLRLSRFSPCEPEPSTPASIIRKRSTLLWSMKQALKSGSSDTICQVASRFFSSNYHHEPKEMSE
ncbi:hypothetical protein GZ77_14590 [Endozoicomonas montiporae]|uniref:Uncharacterized protein n=2 Tax=Endozoicomonas montiporae TaxID=1027273 RepID=A0A081N529_9GAMM|nr:hypothetical protein [Endozoicomonas montiporae]AMO57571.1 hypothetical protein EZMO1_3591 [Endozoicomonas montiporae CL-33]KEQ13552.1 hypothetical protein GZ77_14590 [Endozoicomonas montiporae]